MVTMEPSKVPTWGMRKVHGLVFEIGAGVISTAVMAVDMHLHRWLVICCNHCYSDESTKGIQTRSYT